MKNILILSPHPDDEVIGCGGVICKHIEDGDNVFVTFLTSGEKGGHGKSENETIIVRENESKEAAKYLKITDIEFWKQPDGNLTVDSNNIIRLDNTINKFKADTIYVPHDKEQHPDHEATANLMRKWILQNPKHNVAVWMYEVWTPLQQMDNVVDITPYIEKKKEAISIYKSQIKYVRFEISAIALNRYRGEMHSWPGGDYAEAFKIMKPDSHIQ